MNYAVIQRAFVLVIGALGICMSAIAQTSVITDEQLDVVGAVELGSALTLARPDLFSGVDSATLIHGLPVVTLLDGRRFPISTELGRMGMTPVDVFPTAFLSAVEVQRVTPSLRYGSDATGGVVNLRAKQFEYGGEVGFFYGRSGGDYGREDYSAYIIGGVGNEKFNITAGAMYSESEVRIPRRNRR